MISERLKLLILDNIGCAIAGARLKPIRLLLEHLLEISGRGGANVLGDDISLPASHAGYANSYAACLLSFDDFHVHLGHLGTAIIPGALAVAQELGLSGREVVTALTAGYEMALGLGEAIRPTPAKAAQVQSRQPALGRLRNWSAPSSWAVTSSRASSRKTVELCG
ncbi:MmgE/PrpD family protein [Bosea sp. RAF48]|uniref:MmgE/PrpD family protein n=1 Tax=Bosea sp. RAF48 TaxID=3237480 RepID=UPI003F8F7E7B